MQSSWLYVDGKKTRCECGCELFHKHKDIKGIWLCNCCDIQYADESYEDPSLKRYTFNIITEDIRSLAFVLSELVNMENPPFNDYIGALKWLVKPEEK